MKATGANGQGAESATNGSPENYGRGDVRKAHGGDTSWESEVARTVHGPLSTAKALDAERH